MRERERERGSRREKERRVDSVERWNSSGASYAAHCRYVVISLRIAACELHSEGITTAHAVGPIAPLVVYITAENYQILSFPALFRAAYLTGYNNDHLSI